MSAERRVSAEITILVLLADTVRVWWRRWWCYQRAIMLPLEKLLEVLSFFARKYEHFRIQLRQADACMSFAAAANLEHSAGFAFTAVL